MNHSDFCYSYFKLQLAIDEFLQDKDLSKKEFDFLILAFYNERISTKDYQYTQSIFRRLIGAGLLFKILEEDNQYLASIGQKGVFMVNDFFKFLDNDVREFDESYPLTDRKDFLNKNYLKAEKGKKRLVRPDLTTRIVYKKESKKKAKKKIIKS